MRTSIQVTELENSRNLTVVAIEILENGGLKVTDWSIGEFADEVYGHDVDVIFELSPDSVTKLMSVLSSEADLKTPEDCASFLAQKYKGQNLALRKLREFCDEHGVKYKYDIWV